MDEQTEKLLQELHLIEYNLQNLLTQKQAFQLELNETVNALEEVKKTEDDIYKVLGGIMIKSDKESILKELDEKKNMLDLRVKAIEKQEKLIERRAKELQEEVQKSLKSVEKAK